MEFKPTENGVSIRFPSSSVFAMSSADRYRNIQERRSETTTPFRFTIQKNESLLNGFFTRLALTEVRFPWTLPNISSKAGTNKIGIDVSGGGIITSGIITVPDGFYTPAELATEITTIWNIANPSYTILLDYSNSQGYFVLDTTNPAYYVRIYPDPANTTNFKQLFDIMSWDSGASSFGFVAGALKKSSVVSLRWTDYIDIVATQLTYNQDLKDSSSAQVVRDVLCRLYLDETMISDASYMNTSIVSTTNGTPATITTPLPGYGARENGVRPCIIYRQFQTPKYIKWNKVQPIGQVTFEIFDDQGRALADIIPANYFPNDWNMTMLVSEV